MVLRCGVHMAIDVDEAGFEQAVIERSRSVPVLVDFWAEWCGPCHMLAPVIERAVDATAGAVELVKIDIDANPGIARRYGVQGIPNVKAFRDGELVDEFTGAQPPLVVERFVQGLLPKASDALLAAGDEQSLREAVELDPSRADVRVQLARILLADGRESEALELLRAVDHDREADGLLARSELAGDADAPAVARLGLEALARGEHEAGLRALLEGVQEAAGDTRDRIRRVMIGTFAELGDTDPLAAAIRKRLAASLY
jgi:putative thioredoxin